MMNNEITATRTSLQKTTFIWNPLTIANSLWREKQLIGQFVKREIAIRYRGSYLGLLWSFITPFCMLVVYTFVFSVVFQARWGDGDGGKAVFALLLFAGITTFNILSEVLLKAPYVVIGNANYVKKVVFPLEILPVVTLGAALVNAGISLLILLVGVFFVQGAVHWTAVFVPVVLMPLLLLSLGFGWLLASLGVFLRDIGHIIGLGVQALMFLSPIFYPISAIPAELQIIYYINPLSYVVEDMRRIVVNGQLPSWEWLLLGTAVGLVVAVLGYNWFQKTRGGFADVM